MTLGLMNSLSVLVWSCAGAEDARAVKHEIQAIVERLSFMTSLKNGRERSTKDSMSRTSRSDDRKISEMRNLGPACEQDLEAVGILTAGQLIEMGAEAAFLAMLSGRLKQGRSAKCCNAAYLYAMYGAIHEIDWRELPEKKKDEFKAFAAELRESGRFK